MHPIRRLLVVALASLAIAGPAVAQEYPTKPVRILVPYPPGGASDVTARILADKLSKRWGGKPVFVENKAGANGVIGTETIARADPDGHTIGLVASSHVTNHALMKKVPYELSDMVPVTITAQVQLGLVVNPAVPANNVRELIAYAKANPNKLDVATSGRGSNPQLWALAFQQMTGTQMIDVPYKGSATAHPDLLAGQTQVMFDAVAAVMPHVKAGQAAAARGRRRETLAVPAGHADNPGSRRARLRERVVGRHHRSGEDTDGDHRQAQRATSSRS